LQFELRRELARRAAFALAQSSDAALHEAAHEFVARAYDCRDVRAFVRSRAEGVTYFRLPPKERWDSEVRRLRADDLGPVRAGAAVAMAGGMAEAIATGRTIPGYEELLRDETADPKFVEFGFTYGSLEEVFFHAVAAFGGDHDTATRWLEVTLPGIHSKTERLLRTNWSRIVARAFQLQRTPQKEAA
jgi:hypothetical protein